MEVKHRPNRIKDVSKFHATTFMAVISTMDAAYQKKLESAVIADLWLTALSLISDAAYAKAHAAALDGLFTLEGETVETFPDFTHVGLTQALLYGEKHLRNFQKLASASLPSGRIESEVMKAVGKALDEKGKS